jgi:type IV pilus assembly protein PilZ
MNLTFTPRATSETNGTSVEPFVLRGVVRWINPVKADGDNPNPGMGIQFHDISPDDRERVVETVRTIAYLREEPKSDRPS